MESRLVRGPAPAPEARPCLFVVNDTGETVAVFVDGRHCGWVGPRGSAGLFVGRSAGATTRLRATCAAGFWEATVDGPPWDLRWHLQSAP